MRLIGLLFIAASFTSLAEAQDVVCSKKMKKVITIGEGDSFSFKTQKGAKYLAKTKCQVTYKKGSTCPSIQFTCSEFDVNSKKKSCKGGDTMMVIADGKNTKFCQTSSPDVTTAGNLKVVFNSNKKTQSTGAVCTVQCAGDSSPTTLPTTTLAATTATTLAATTGGQSCCDVLNVEGELFPNGKYTKVEDKHYNKPVYQHSDGKKCIFFARHWKVDKCDFISPGGDWSQGMGWSKKDMECPGDIGKKWRYYSWGEEGPDSGPVDPSIKIDCEQASATTTATTTTPTTPATTVGPALASPCDNSGCSLQTQYGSPETLSVFTKGIFAIWWDRVHDHSEDAEPMADILLSIREDCLKNLGMMDPPNPAKGFYFNVYIHHGEDDLFPSRWGMGVGTDTFGLPYLTMHYGGLFSQTLWHEGFHVFQYEASSPGFAYNGDSQWYIESTAQWYTVKTFKDDKKLFRTAGAIVANPHLALWHSFSNQAPDDPAHNAGRPGWMYGVRQYGMHAYLMFLTDVMGVDRSVVTDGFYASTNELPQEYIFKKVGAERMRGLFADWAAHNTGGLDYLTKEQVERAYLEITLAGDWDYFRPYVWSSVDQGTDGEWFTPQTELTARGWAYNVLNINNTLSTSYTFQLEGDAAGSQGADSFFVGRIVVMSKDGPLYSEMTMTSPTAGEATVNVTPDDSSVFLVVASVPEYFRSYQHYSYKVKVSKV